MLSTSPRSTRGARSVAFKRAVSYNLAFTIGLYRDGPLHIDSGSMQFAEENLMEWTKPEFTVVAVTMEVTAYAATK